MPFNIKDVVKETATQKIGTVEDIRHGGVTLYYVQFTKFGDREWKLESELELEKAPNPDTGSGFTGFIPKRGIMDS